MNILVFSDSHRNTKRMLEVVRNSENTDLILHLGDNTEDAKKIAEITDTPLVVIKGNTDYTDEPEELLLEKEGFKLLLTHGHRFKIKSGLQSLYYRSKELGADLALYGHSHVASNEEIGGIVFLNPGSIGDKRGQKYYSYGKITLKNKALDVAICYLP
ncbi:metallophosphoesterase [Alkalibacter rhizosphaerae]|uniref:Phosphoesterase n=1 Tax=Alkalibacter rhizosphaerae TaxID=2815577 RepID=A0A974XDX1_9FIRM|nr:metallophosphoesterase [Alkalibacter rhizosphaerae]QSX08067.1 metallophosphoesterase [Alkalibacter rhizosphaerae]